MKAWRLVGWLMAAGAVTFVGACNGEETIPLGDGDGDGDTGDGDTGDGDTGDGDTGDGDTGDGDTGDGDMGGATNGGAGGMNGGDGDSAPSSECSEYCTLWFDSDCNNAMQVASGYDDEDACHTVCAGLSHEGTDGAMKGNSVQCRITQLSGMNPVCGAAQEMIAMGKCTGDPQ